MRSDIRFALRLLRRSPGFTAMAIVSLALGIAANTTVFSLIDAMLYRTLPVRDPGTLVNIYRTAKTGGIRFSSYPIYAALRQYSTTLSDLAAHYSTAPLNVITGIESGEVQGAVVSGNYFSMLGIQPLLGRFFLPDEDQARGRNPVSVIGFGLWQRRFGGDPGRARPGDDH